MKHRGVTLIELLVVAAIIAILATIVFSVMGHGFTGNGGRYRVTQPISNKVWISRGRPVYYPYDRMYHFTDSETGREIDVSAPIQTEEIP